MSDTPARLLACPGCGSAVVEMAFALAGLPLEVEDVDYAAGSPTRGRLVAANPLGQVPALLLPDGRVLTESLAIVQHVDDLAPAAGLVPPAGHPARDAWLRWSAFLVGAVYPTFTYGDDPRKWVPDEAGAKALRAATDRHREALWRQVAAQAGTPWFLGGTRSAIDLYLVAMTRWRPGRRWFEENAPTLAAIAARAAALPGLARALARNFP